MRWRFIFLVVLIIGLLAAVSTVAARPGSAIAPGVVALEINGLDEEQTAAVLPALEVASYRNRSSIGERRLQRLLRQIEGEVDGALEVFGYYAATTQVRLDPFKISC